MGDGDGDGEEGEMWPGKGGGGIRRDRGLTMKRIAAAKQYIENHYRAPDEEHPGAQGEVEHVRAERNLLETEVASHCIVKLYYSFQDAEYLYLIMEYLPGGDMMNLLIKEETLTESVAKFYIAQSVLAIESIHKHNYIHRWSLGAIMSEMLLGFPPFSDPDPITTCRKIVHWRKHLMFPEEIQLTPEAKDLICRLLCDADHRLGSHQIKAHPWFKDIVWDKIYEMEAAFKPEVNDELDTQNFPKFVEEELPAPARTGSGSSRKMLRTPKDLSFVGYTYKNFAAVKEMKKSTSLKRLSLDSIFGKKSTTEETDTNMDASSYPMTP
ncbi:hypothetical protein J5N97_025590 [Dioscorea zingiberensis]|uniref:non-specific serine/threonine protein kinase n=1 Tax=Dioscorea zingiberensis TaxID=325984 RepID=A0A9D5C1T1_9LILI|nr:hypothetical protein J5N97_025590 [Dioscorea zingiberensis]